MYYGEGIMAMLSQKATLPGDVGALAYTAEVAISIKPLSTIDDCKTICMWMWWGREGGLGLPYLWSIAPYRHIFSLEPLKILYMHH